MRAYLFLVQRDIEISVHRGFETLTRAWEEAREQHAHTSGLVHVGIDRPSETTVADLLGLYPGRVLVSESARWCLPNGFKQSSFPVTHLEVTESLPPLPIYIASSGWGYELDGEAAYCDVSQQDEAREDGDALTTWIADLQDPEPELFASVLNLGVQSDDFYLKRRRQLPLEIRDRVDDIRFERMRLDINESDLFSLFRIAPDWLLSFPVEELSHLSVRARNALLREGIFYVYQIVDLGFEGLMGLENFGMKSYHSIAPALIREISEKPYQRVIYNRRVPEPISHLEDRSRSPVGLTIPTAEEEGNSPPIVRSLFDEVGALLSKLDPRDRGVLEDRLARNDPPKTLEEIGDSLGLSRERARQLESRGLRVLLSSPVLQEIEVRIDALLADRNQPLYLDLIAIEDEWFKGFERELPFLSRLIERCSDGRYCSWELKDRPVVTRTTQRDWNDLERDILQALHDRLGSSLTAQEVRLLVDSFASKENCPELATTLLSHLDDALHYVDHPASSAPVLGGVGRGVKAVLMAVMEETDEPLPFGEIVRRAVDRTGDDVTEMTYRGALRSIGAYPFSGRRYGLASHIDIPEHLLPEILSTLEAILREGNRIRQWHSSELAEEALERRPDFPENLDSYAANIILNRSKKAQYLGRMVWASDDEEWSSTSDRFDISDLCVHTLTEAGRPLSTQEVEEQIRRFRGLNSTFLMNPNEFVARVEPGKWGLVERDFIIGKVGRERLLDGLHEYLQRRAKALHVSEISAAIQDAGVQVPREMTNYMLLGLSQTDDRFRVFRGSLLGLATWTSINRLSVRAAIRQAATDAGDRVTAPAIYRKVDELTERTIEPYIVNTALKDFGFSEISEGVWEMTPGEASDFD